MADVTGTGYRIELPSGGEFPANTADEVEIAEQVAKDYVDEFNLDKGSDLAHVSAIIVQRLLIHRANLELSGFEPVYDRIGRPTGELRKKDRPTAPEIKDLQKVISEANGEIRAIEKALGVDKATREKGGKESVQDYLKTVKAAAHKYGVRLSERTIEYHDLMKACSWRLRMLEKGDKDDLREHNLSWEKFGRWLSQEIQAVEEKDKKWAKDDFSVFVGKL